MRYPERVKRKHVQKKKAVKICFSKTEDDGAEKAAVEVSEPVNEKAPGSPQTQHFEDVVCQLAELCLTHVNEKKSERHLVFLSLLLQSFHTPRIFSVSHRCLFKTEMHIPLKPFCSANPGILFV